MTDEVANTEATETKTEGGLTKIEATETDTERKCAVYYDFGADVNDAVAKFGDKVVHSNFVSKSIITAQAIIRRAMKAKKTDAEIEEIFKTWKPGVAVERSFDPLAAALKKFEDMTAEEQTKYIEDLKAKLKA